MDEPAEMSVVLDVQNWNKAKYYSDKCQAEGQGPDLHSLQNKTYLPAEFKVAYSLTKL